MKNLAYACIHFTIDVEGEIGAIRFPNNMYYEANVRGGTFILEAATAGAPTTWIAMVATESGGTTKLGREGILNATPVASGAAGNVVLSKTVYTIAPAAGAYTWPALGALTTPTLAYNVQSTTCTVAISGGSSASNTLAYFSACLISTITWALGVTAVGGSIELEMSTSCAIFVCAVVGATVGAGARGVAFHRRCSRRR